MPPERLPAIPKRHDDAAEVTTDARFHTDAQQAATPDARTFNDASMLGNGPPGSAEPTWPDTAFEAAVVLTLAAR
jgi:hypothetical protein